MSGGQSYMDLVGYIHVRVHVQAGVHYIHEQATGRQARTYTMYPYFVKAFLVLLDALRRSDIFLDINCTVAHLA